MSLMMVVMMLVMMVGAVLLLMFILGIVRNTDGKAKHAEFEKPKRHRVALSDDGELVEIGEDDSPLPYDAEERR